MPVGSTSNAGKTGRGPIIEVKNLRKEYPVLDETVVALERVNLAIPQGQICCIYGESDPVNPPCSISLPAWKTN